MTHTSGVGQGPVGLFSDCIRSLNSSYRQWHYGTPVWTLFCPPPLPPKGSKTSWQYRKLNLWAPVASCPIVSTAVSGFTPAKALKLERYNASLCSLARGRCTATQSERRRTTTADTGRSVYYRVIIVPGVGDGSWSAVRWREEDGRGREGGEGTEASAAMWVVQLGTC